MGAHQIDHGTAVITGTFDCQNSQPWMRILFSYPGACFITGEQAIKNLRAACDAALGEGENE